MEAVDQNGVDHDVDDVDDQGVGHGHLAVAHSPEEGGAGIVDGDKGVGGRCQQEIDQGRVHDILRNIAKKYP